MWTRLGRSTDRATHSRIRRERVRSEKGQSFIGYVVLVLIILGTLFPVVAYICRTVAKQGAAVAKQTTGDTREAERLQEEARDEAQKAEDAAENNNRSFHDLE